MRDKQSDRKAQTTVNKYQQRNRSMQSRYWIAMLILMVGIGILTWSITIGPTVTNQESVLTPPFVKSLGVIGLLVSMVLFVLVTRHDREKNTIVNRKKRAR
jgi:cytochrome bd-type quinol oxidase subunit 2